MPEYVTGELRPKLIVNFTSKEEREQFASKMDVHVQKSNENTWSCEFGKPVMDDSANCIYDVPEDSSDES